MALEQYDLAMQELTKCSKVIILDEYVDWYMALYYLKIGDHETSRSLLAKIVENDRYYSPDAKSLLKNMKELDK